MQFALSSPLFRIPPFDLQFICLSQLYSQDNPRRSKYFCNPCKIFLQKQCVCDVKVGRKVVFCFPINGLIVLAEVNKIVMSQSILFHSSNELFSEDQEEKSGTSADNK